MNIKSMIFATLILGSNLTIISIEQESIINQLEEYALQQNNTIIADNREQSFNKKNYADFVAEVLIIEKALSNPSLSTKERAALELDLESSLELMSRNFETFIWPAKIRETEKAIVRSGIHEILFCLKHDKNLPTVAALDECHN